MESEKEQLVNYFRWEESLSRYFFQSSAHVFPLKVKVLLQETLLTIVLLLFSYSILSVLGGHEIPSLVIESKLSPVFLFPRCFLLLCRFVLRSCFSILERRRIELQMGEFWGWKIEEPTFMRNELFMINFLSIYVPRVNSCELVISCFARIAYGPQNWHWIHEVLCDTRELCLILYAEHSNWLNLILCVHVKPLSSLYQIFRSPVRYFKRHAYFINEYLGTLVPYKWSIWHISMEAREPHPIAT